MFRPFAQTFVPLAALGLLCSGCFWGEADAHVFFKVSSENYDQYLSLLYPTGREEAWQAMFEGRTPACPPDDDNCEVDAMESTGLVDLYLPYETTRVRGLVTQKGDLQITAHLDVGEAFAGLAEDGYDSWAYMENADELYGVGGSGCGSELGVGDRTGIGRCLRTELIDNGGGYTGLGEDLRLVLSVNLPGADDVRSTACQGRPQTFESSDWTYPRTLRVNYNANQPEENADGHLVYGEETPPLPQCDIEVYARLQVGIEVFSADRFGNEDDDLHLGMANGADETMTGTVEMVELLLPDEDGDAVARGRYDLKFTSDRFSAKDGEVQVAGEFDVGVRFDSEQVEEPDRDIDMSDTVSDSEGY